MLFIVTIIVAIVFMSWPIDVRLFYQAHEWCQFDRERNLDNTDTLLWMSYWGKCNEIPKSHFEPQPIHVGQPIRGGTTCYAVPEKFLLVDSHKGFDCYRSREGFDGFQGIWVSVTKLPFDVILAVQYEKG